MIPSKRKPYNKRAKIFTEEAQNRFKRHHRKNTQVYQNFHVQKVGYAYSYLLMDIAHVKTRAYFLKMYGTKLNPHNSRLIPVILELCGQTSTGAIKVGDLNQWALSVGYQARINTFTPPDLSKSWHTLIRNSFINPLGDGYFMPTTRAKQFSIVFDKEYKKLIKESGIPTDE